MARSEQSGFTLVDVIVSTAVMAILISLLIPALGHAKEAANRVRCASNMRQLGLAMQVYAQDHNDRPPKTIFDGSHSGFQPQPQKTVIVHLDAGEHSGIPAPAHSNFWDGMGWFYVLNYLRYQDVYYCPSHTGDHPKEAYADLWSTGTGQIVTNYLYRILDEKYLSTVPPSTALVADSTSVKSDYNHKSGNNVLRADFSVSWFKDDGTLFDSLAEDRNTIESKQSVNLGWAMFDEGITIDPDLD